MSISSKKVVSKPIGVQEVANLLHVKPDVGTLCCAKTKINPWSKHKPLDFPNYSELTEQQMASVNYGLDLTSCAVGTMNGQNVGGGLYAIDQLGVQAQTWVYHSPADSSTARYRLTDFNGYKHKGQAYRSPVRFFPIKETYAEETFTIERYKVYDNNYPENWHYHIDSDVKYVKSYGREAQNTRATFTGIHVSSWGYGGFTTYIAGYYRVFLKDSNYRITYDTGQIPFEFRQTDDPDPYDSLNRIGVSVEVTTKTRGKGPWELYFEVCVTDLVSTCQTIEKAEFQITPIFSLSEYSDWREYLSMQTGFGVRIPECSGDWAENNHAYEKELLHYTDPSTGETIYCTDPMFILTLEDDSGNSMGNRYWFPLSSSIVDTVTPYSMGFGVYGDLRSIRVTGLYMFFCNKEKVYRTPSGGVGTGNCTDTINTTDTVIFPAPYCKWDWDAIKKS